MGIVISPSPSILEERAYLTGKRIGVVARAGTISSTAACGFELYDCCWPIPQFVDQVNPTDLSKNDFRTFIFEAEPDETTSGIIYNLTTGEEADINDDTYGELYSLGDFPERPLVLGIKIEWLKVVQLMGYGKYRILEQTFVDHGAGPVLARTIVDQCFDVQPFSCEAAHGTVRFETVQTGYIHNGFDYRGIFTNAVAGLHGKLNGWKQQLRWYGQMIPDVPEEQSDFIQMSSRIEEQIQQKTTKKFKIELYRVKSDFGNQLTDDNFMASEILASDYNLNNYEAYRNRHLRKISTDSVGVQKLNSGINLTFTFKEMDEGTLKRIYG